MRAILCNGYGGPEVMEWAEAPAPQPAAGEVLIKVAAAGVNRADILQRMGKYPPPAGAPDIIGLEVAGIVAALGDNVTRWKIGDKVCALLAGGGYAEYVAAPEGQCMAVPDGWSMAEAAAFTEAATTVWANIFEAGNLQPHNTVLVHGGASGIGTTAIQMVKAFGAKVFVTVGSDEKLEICRKLGSDLALNYKTQDFVTAVNDATQGKGVDVVLDMVGGDYLNRNLSCLAVRGRHISIATQQNRIAPLDLRLVMQKQAIVTGSTLRGRPVAEKTRLMAAMQAFALPWIAKNQLKPLIYHAWPIKNAAEAHKMMESGVHSGKLVLEVMV